MLPVMFVGATTVPVVVVLIYHMYTNESTTWEGVATVAVFVVNVLYMTLWERQIRLVTQCIVVRPRASALVDVVPVVVYLAVALRWMAVACWAPTPRLAPFVVMACMCTAICLVVYQLAAHGRDTGLPAYA